MEWIDNSKIKVGFAGIALLFFLSGIFMLLLIAGLIYTVVIRKVNTPAKEPIQISYEQMPVKTNSWFSSAYKFPTTPIYVHPLVVQFEERGMSFSYPDVIKNKNVVLSSFQAHCTVGFPGQISGINVRSYDDWSVEIKLEKNNSSVFLIKGLPFLYIKTNNITIDCGEGEREDSDGDSLVFNVKGKKYIVQAKGFLEINDSDGLLTISSQYGEFRIAPFFDAADSFFLLKKADWLTSDRTQVSWHLEGNFFITNYNFPGLRENSLIVLYPHQYNYLRDELPSVGAYETALGELKVLRGSKFSTKVPLPDLQSTFVKVKNEAYKNSIRDAVVVDVESFMNLSFPEGVYFRGTMLGALASLVQLADIYAPEKLMQTIDLLEKELVTYLSEFEYDAQKKMLIAKKPEFGNEAGNDHHFHYGYFIRSAAVLELYKPGALGGGKKVIDEMAYDIASLSSEKYPRLRSFSVYEGHSWASGYADFADGNNQESSSEALNAWYSLHLWGKVSNNPELLDLGLWLYSQELIGAKSYWFGIKNPFPGEYIHQIAGIVWGGKRDFSTWFSGETMHIYGIQLLPITPASFYYFSQIADYKYVKEIENYYPNPLLHEWGDLYVTFLSFIDSKKAEKLVSSLKTTSGTKLKSLVMQIVFDLVEKSAPAQE